MAPVPVEPQIRYLPLAAAAGHALAVTTLTIIVIRGLYRSSKEIPPSQGTRGRLSRRSILSPLFAALSVISLITAGYSALTYAKLSYHVWADQRAVEVPNRVYGEEGSILSYGGHNTTELHVGQWLSDTPVYLDAFEILVEKARRFWWGQQLELATVSWSLLLSIEGRRRNIPFTWAYLALAHLVSLPFAQNLFYLALLLTPTPMPVQDDTELPGSRYIRIRNRLFPPKPVNWSPSPAVYLLCLAQTFGVLFAAPLTTGTEGSVKLMLVGKALTFAPLILPVIVPRRWGQVHSHPHGAYDSVTEVFRFVATAAFFLQAKALALGLFHNTPDAYFHRHSKFLPFDKEERSSLERTATAVSKLLGSASDHPVVAAAARDVVLCAVSLAIWAAIRGLEVNDILACATPFFRSRHDGETTDVTSSPDSSGARGGSEAVTGPAGSTRQKSRSTVGRRSRANNASTTDDAPQKTYIPSPAEDEAAVEGDVVPEDEMDWEAAALTWGLNVLGGLGFGSAGTFGAECTSR